MKAWAPVLMGCIVVATAMMFAPWSGAPAPAPSSVAARPAPAAAPAPPRSSVSDKGFAAIGTAFARDAASPSRPDPLAAAEAKAAADQAAQADDARATRADTVPATAPREL